MSDTDTLGTRHPDSVPWVIDERIFLYLERTRLYDLHLIAYDRVDRAIITTLVERWRQETHTFYLPLDEATITLLDGALLTRLPIEECAMSTTGRQLSSWRDMVQYWENALQQKSLGGAVCGAHGWFTPSRISPKVQTIKQF